MEYVRGESLARLLRAEKARGRSVPLPIASAIVIGALHGLHAAHEATSDRGAPLGIVHRDVSPQNILVGVDGVARVIDFGVAKAAGRLQTTREGVIKGKVAYMAPEQLAAAEVTRRVDVYAMAVVLWEMLAGRRLFQVEGDAQLVVKALAGATDPPSRYNPDLSAELDALVMTGLARDPDARFATAREMAERLQRLVPPAFPTEVGPWVEDAANEALAHRGSQLAEIESGSGLASVVPAAGEGSLASRVPGPARALGGEGGDAATVVSQPSSLSVATPTRHLVARTSRSWSTRARIVALGLAVLVGAGAVAILRPGVTAREGTPTAPGPVTSVLGASVVPAVVAPASSGANGVEGVVTGSPASAPSATVASPAPPARAPATETATPRPSAHLAPRPRPAPKPASSLRFVQPD